MLAQEGFGCNLMHCKVLASSHQHLMAEAPLGAEQGHTELESGHAPTVSYGESSCTAASRWTAPSIRVARGSLSQLGRSRYSAGRREVRPQHLPPRADHALQHVLEGGPGPRVQSQTNNDDGHPAVRLGVGEFTATDLSPTCCGFRIFINWTNSVSKTGGQHVTGSRPTS